MKCKNCGKEIVDDAYRKVAEWTFCPECFQGFLDKSENKATPAETETPNALPSEANDAIRCPLCGKTIGDGPVKKVGIWTFCPDCYASLAHRPEPEIAAPETTQTDNSNLEGPDGEEMGAQSATRLNPVEPVNCRACGRKIPMGGAREVDGQFLCPDCYSEWVKRVNVSLQFATQQKTGDVGPGDRHPDSHHPGKTTDCESCGRKVPADLLEETEGFLICPACRSTDIDLALKLAHTRHRKKLERLLSDSGA